MLPQHCLMVPAVDERLCVFDRLRFQGPVAALARMARLFDNAHGAMQTLVWHKDQKAVSASA